jgi:hypothetical protein
MIGAWAVASAAGLADATAMLARVCLGGGPVVTEVAGPSGGGTTLEPTALSGMLLLILGVFALFGFLRGFDRDWRSTAIIAGCYWLVGSQWDVIARWVNHFYKLFVFAVVKRGVLVDDPTAAWKAVGDLAGLIPTDGPVVIWQIAIFTLGVMAAYAFSQATGQRPPVGPLHVFNLMNVVIRLLGASLGSVSGYLIGVFTLNRLFPTSHIGLAGLRSAAQIAFLQHGPAVVLGTVMLLIVFGVLSLNGGKKRTTYGSTRYEGTGRAPS